MASSHPGVLGCTSRDPDESGVGRPGGGPAERDSAGGPHPGSLADSHRLQVNTHAPRRLPAPAAQRWAAADAAEAGSVQKALSGAHPRRQQGPWPYRKQATQPPAGTDLGSGSAVRTPSRLRLAPPGLFVTRKSCPSARARRGAAGRTPQTSSPMVHRARARHASLRPPSRLLAETAGRCLAGVPRDYATPFRRGLLSSRVTSFPLRGGARAAHPGRYQARSLGAALSRTREEELQGDGASIKRSGATWTELPGRRRREQDAAAPQPGRETDGEAETEGGHREGATVHSVSGGQGRSSGSHTLSCFPVSCWLSPCGSGSCVYWGVERWVSWVGAGQEEATAPQILPQGTLCVWPPRAVGNASCS
ncbi:Hypothetical predicted protein [Marmota monax]|uniref:Uncharacterized protein n=1 Tax=Marmota monax TaxID=9995 RepID=A0A5E4AKJ3_MARMO|nr:Hypothetical predicted protein [Marmota monax]